MTAIDPAKLQITQVPIGKLKLFPGNPRRGDVNGIAESIAVNGFFDPIAVQSGTNHIIGGNHTYQASVLINQILKGEKAEPKWWKKLAKKPKAFKTLPCIVFEVSDDQAKRMNLAANRLADKGSYDPQALVAMMQELGDAAGTGYSDDEWKMLTSVTDRSAMDAIGESLRSNSSLLAQLSGAGTLDDDDDDEGVHTDIKMPTPHKFDDDDDDEEGQFEAAEDELKGAVQLKDDMKFEGRDADTMWNIPLLRTDMLMQVDELPDNLDSWAGSATKNWPDPEQWWLYNVGIDSTSGMLDVSKCVVSFYCFDEYFENWWWFPERWVSKLLNSNIRYIVGPDFSPWSSNPRIVNMWAIFRQRWLSRYFQECGLKLIPNVSWANGETWLLDNVILPTLPKHAPILATQMQTFKLDVDGTPEYGAEIKHIFDDVLQPDTLLLYAGEPGRDFVESLGLQCNIRWIGTRVMKLAEQAKGRQKKKGL